MATNNPSVIISGASGFIGSNLVRYFSRKKYRVHALVRSVPTTAQDNVTYHAFDLKSPMLDPDLLKQADFFIHTAFIESKNAKDAWAQNVKAAEVLLKQCHKHKIRFIFFSSLSAHQDAISDYGKQKFAIEHMLKARDVALRLGLVIGNGGLVKRMATHIKKLRVVPLVDHGKQPLQIIYIGDLLAITEKLLTSKINGTLHIAGNKAYTYKIFYQMLGKKVGRRPIFVSVPFGLFYLLLQIADALKLKLGVSKDNLLGLKKMHYIETAHDLKKIGVKLRSLEDSLERVDF